MNDHFIPKEKINFIYHLAEHCNLNCKGCDHFSPIADKVFVDPAQFEKDFARMSELFGSNCIKIGLMGGEPLLNPHINKYIEIARKYFKNAQIRVVTNGILLEKVQPQFWEDCQKYDIEIEYTKYPIQINHNKMNEIAERYEVKLTSYATTGYIEKTLYFMPLDLAGKQDPYINFEKCYHANNCIQLKDGKLYTCTIIPNIEHFNAQFNRTLPVTRRDYINIYEDGLTKEKITEQLARPVPFCKYCNVSKRTNGHPWTVSSKSIYEWIPFDLNEEGIKELKKYSTIIVYGAGKVAKQTIPQLIKYIPRENIKIAVTKIEGQAREIEQIPVQNIIDIPREKNVAVLIATRPEFQIKIETLCHELNYRNIYLLNSSEKCFIE